MPLPSDYQRRSAAEKLDLLWAEIQSDPYPDGALPTEVPGVWGRRHLFSVDFNRGSFEHAEDELPAGRAKLVHTHGTCARVTVKVTASHPYTGVFAKGGQAILRFSDATGGGDFTPSLALKFFVDGKPSVNLLALPKAPRAPKDQRFFSSAYANATFPATSFDKKLVQSAFQKAAKALGGTRLYAVYLPLHHIASVHVDGTPPAKAEVPDRIELHPTAEAVRAAGEGGDWRAALAKIPAGTKLFELKVSPRIDAEATPYGELWLESKCVASRYGDERLFFQHDVGPT
jgi:hypothetical protein